jgi:hypothetical protein
VKKAEQKVKNNSKIKKWKKNYEDLTSYLDDHKPKKRKLVLPKKKKWINPLLDADMNRFTKQQLMIFNKIQDAKELKLRKQQNLDEKIFEVRRKL